MTAGDRQRLLAHLEMTESWLQSELKGLSEAQLRFRMKPESWSITDVVEHLSIAEPQYWKQLTDSMNQPPKTEKLEATDGLYRGMPYLALSEDQIDVLVAYLLERK